jgi:hypothetical protein
MQRFRIHHLRKFLDLDPAEKNQNTAFCKKCRIIFELCIIVNYFKLRKVNLKTYPNFWGCFNWTSTKLYISYNSSGSSNEYVSVGSFFKKILFLNIKSAVATRPTPTTVWQREISLQIVTHNVESIKLFHPFQISELDCQIQEISSVFLIRTRMLCVGCPKD